MVSFDDYIDMQRRLFYDPDSWKLIAVACAGIAFTGIIALITFSFIIGFIITILAIFGLILSIFIFVRIKKNPKKINTENIVKIKSNKIIRYWYLLIFIGLIIGIIFMIVLNHFLKDTAFSFLASFPLFIFVVFALYIRFLVIFYSRKEYVYDKSNDNK